MESIGRPRRGPPQLFGLPHEGKRVKTGGGNLPVGSLGDSQNRPGEL